MKDSISKVIDDLGISKFTMLLLFMVGLVQLFDGFDNMVVSYTMPQITKEWALTKVQTGSLVSWGFFGAIFGAIVAGYLSDKLGRKKTTIFAIICYSIFCGLTYFAPDFNTYVILRILTGFGYGAAIPVTITIISELVPKKNRGFFVASLSGFLIVGWILAGLVSMVTIPAFGWRAIYLVGVLPIIYIVAVVKYLPESPRWLLSKGRNAEVVEIIQRIEKSAKGVTSNWDAGSFSADIPTKAVGFSTLLSKKFFSRTISLAVMYFALQFIVFGVNGWLPTLLFERGYSIVKSYSFSISLNIAGIIGCLLTGFLADKLGRRKIEGFSMAFTGLFVLLFGNSSNQWQILAFAMLTGFCMNLAMAGLQPLLVETFPTEVRTTGVSLVTALGRFGSIAGPLAVGFVQQRV